MIALSSAKNDDKEYQHIFQDAKDSVQTQGKVQGHEILMITRQFSASRLTITQLPDTLIQETSSQTSSMMRHAEIIIRDTGAENLKTISTPATKETGRETEEERRQDLNGLRLSGKLGSKTDNDDKEDALSADEVTRYRRVAARANFLAQDRMDISYATKEATRRMTVPTTDDWNKLGRLERYRLRLEGQEDARYPRVVTWYKYQHA